MQSNNQIASVTKYGTDDFGDLTGNYKGSAYKTFFDTGSNGNFFPDNFPLCSSSSSFYCPSSEQSLSASITGSEGNTATVPAVRAHERAHADFGRRASTRSTASAVNWA